MPPPAAITLEVIAGPPLPSGERSVRIDADHTPAEIGRGTDCALQLTDATVSRRHARVDHEDDVWIITDLGSRHGTFINGNQLTAETPHPLASRDQVRVGPWILRAKIGHPSRMSSMASITDDQGLQTTRVQAVPARELRSLAQQRLDVIIDCAARINAASDFDALAGVALESVIAGAGFARAAMVRPPKGSEQAEVIAYRSVTNEDAAALELSRSLLETAASGQVARLTSDAPSDAAKYGQSIVQLGIHSAICAPIQVGEGVEALMYLDARGSENTVRHDAAAFCQAIARLSGLAAANIRRQHLEHTQRSLETDLNAAREAQRLIMPPAHATRGWHAYALETRPGRVVAGDLYDVVNMTGDPAGPVACLLGDVTGKGVGAAITMATVQTHLRVALRHCDDPAEVVTEVNRAIVEKMTGGKFISLWLGIIDPDAREIRYVDAGHGHWLVRRPGASPERIECEGGLPLGLDTGSTYITERTAFDPGSRLILFSDGLIEQPDPSGEMFGMDRTLDALAPAGSSDEDVERLADAVRRHAATDALADDLTVASHEFLTA